MQRVYVNTKKAIAGLAHKKEREFEKETNIHASVAYLETRQTSTTDHFYENCQCLKVVNYFRIKAPSQKFGLTLKNVSILLNDRNWCHW